LARRTSPLNAPASGPGTIWEVKGGTQVMKASTSTRSGLGESDARVMMHRAKTVARVLLIVALVATLVALIAYRPLAYLAAIPVPVLFVAWVMLILLERQTRQSELRRAGQSTLSEEETQLDVRDAGIYTALGILFLLALGTFIIAAALFDWPLVGGVAAVGFLLAVLINLPYVLLCVQEAERDEQEKLDRQREAAGTSDASEQQAG
jgi:hypothetical protein